ncbi:aldose 1-epimerase [Litorimonas taeanensis]|uniref:Aldose 1-epimerase n=1 Tax=Litorimonas taeanensis TaxID=568099 RepID=A0A420WJQ6_9PROT|nr:hypothetical protein [Litorimonas taeanensis]RKQ71156.1 aldose 1-epimerase [Litorimonas taeanensis]
MPLSLKEKTKPRVETLDIAHGGWSLQLAPSHGAAILSCQYNGRDILRPAPPDWFQTPNPLMTGHFPLAPYSNRIENGTFQFKGRNHVLSWDKLEQPHPLHGTAWQSKWDVVQSDVKKVTLQMCHAQPSQTWPWRFTASHSLCASEDGLHFTLSVTNDDTQSMPSGLGFHPYFATHDTAELQFQSRHVWMSNDDKLPVRLAKLPEAWDFTRAKTVSKVSVDHCFTGLKLPAYFNWPQAHQRVCIQGSKNLTHAVVYLDNPTKAACFEPVTHMNNGLNWRHEHADTGIEILNPGETQTAEMILSIEDY